MEKQKQTEFTIRIGALLKGIIEQQKKQIEEATYDCVKPSDLEAGEIIAKKYLKSI